MGNHFGALVQSSLPTLDLGEDELTVRIRGLTKSFDARPVIDRLDLDIRQGEFVALLGPSGCGKTTLLRILSELDTEIGGDVLVAPERAVAFQQPRLFPWKRVWKNVVTGLPDPKDRERAVRALAEVKLTHRTDVWPKVLSGGEAQRVSLARALVREPQLMLLDEPFSALDALTRLEAQRLVVQLWQHHRPSILLVTHDVVEAISLADRVLVMLDGRIEHAVEIDAERPRELGEPALNEARKQILGWLGVNHD